MLLQRSRARPFRLRSAFAGCRALRFWEFEDAQVDFGSVDAGPTDLARMLLVEFALTYGNDWFVIPIELDVGSLHRTPFAGHHRHVRRPHADQILQRAGRAPFRVANVPAFPYAWERIHQTGVESVFPASVAAQESGEPAD